LENLLYKEFRLVTHPTVYLFWGLAAMLLIPNYPYYVVFFYCSLGIFFSCHGARENNDIMYTATLPIEKSDTVRARILFAVLIELMQFLLAAVFAMLRKQIPTLGANLAGMDANVALFGMAFVMMGIFNFVFFTAYYKDPNKVGKCFAAASIIQFLYIAAAEAAVHILPFMKYRLDTPDPEYFTLKLAVLAVGLISYVMLTIFATVKAVRSFEKLDL